MKIKFLERANTAKHEFPFYGTEWTAPEKQIYVENGTPFFFNGLKFEFDETVSSNGWWAINESTGHHCLVAFYDQNEVFLG